MSKTPRDLSRFFSSFSSFSIAGRKTLRQSSWLPRSPQRSLPLSNLRTGSSSHRRRTSPGCRKAPSKPAEVSAPILAEAWLRAYVKHRPYPSAASFFRETDYNVAKKTFMRWNSAHPHLLPVINPGRHAPPSSPKISHSALQFNGGPRRVEPR